MRYHHVLARLYIMKTQRANIRPFTTKDHSEIRELMHPNQHDNRQQSLAEAIVAAGQTTQLHQHRQTEELYHVLEGSGEMQLGNERFTVIPGDTVCIPPGTPHCIHNLSNTALRFLCCCSPPYSDDDTEILDQ